MNIEKYFIDKFGDKEEVRKAIDFFKKINTDIPLESIKEIRKGILGTTVITIEGEDKKEVIIEIRNDNEISYTYEGLMGYIKNVENNKDLARIATKLPFYKDEEELLKDLEDFKKNSKEGKYAVIINGSPILYKIAELRGKNIIVHQGESITSVNLKTKKVKYTSYEAKNIISDETFEIYDNISEGIHTLMNRLGNIPKFTRKELNKVIQNVFGYC